METSPIYELLPAFKERNNLTFLLLGLLSMSQEWMDLLETEAQRARLHPEPDTDLQADDHSRGFLYFLLGTIAFSSHFSRVLDSARIVTTTPQVADQPISGWGDDFSLLR